MKSHAYKLGYAKAMREAEAMERRHYRILRKKALEAALRERQAHLDGQRAGLAAGRLENNDGTAVFEQKAERFVLSIVRAVAHIYEQDFRPVVSPINGQRYDRLDDYLRHIWSNDAALLIPAKEIVH